MSLRDFLYLDRDLVRSFLAQAEGGAFDEQTEREKSSGTTGFAGKAGYGPLSIGAEKSKEKSLETEAVIKQVAASEFDRLYKYLESEEGLITIEEARTVDDLESVRRKTFVEVDARIRESGLQKMMGLLQSFSAVAPVLQQMGKLEDSSAEGLEAMTAFGSLNQSLAVIGRVSGAVGFQVGLELDPAHTLADSWDVDATVLLKVQRVLGPDESQVIGDPFGGLMKLMPDADRGKLLESLNTPEANKFGISGDTEIHYPAVLGTPIAIYR